MYCKNERNINALTPKMMQNRPSTTVAILHYEVAYALSIVPDSLIQSDLK